MTDPLEKVVEPVTRATGLLNSIDDVIFDWLTGIGLTESAARAIADFSGFSMALAFGILGFYVARIIMVGWIHRLARNSKSQWDDKLIDRRVFHTLAYLAPAIIILYLTPLVIPERKIAILIVDIFLKVYMLIITLLVIYRSLDAVHDIYQTYEISKSRPIKSFLQVIKIIIFIIIASLVFSVLFLKDSSFKWVAGLGAFSAVLLLVFKDPILGFAGGLQLAFNDMLRIGDWIEMPKYGADGNVIDISLTTVKVQNFDMTITTIPTYALVSDSYKNWRGMQESGGRRIKRSVNIDINSVKFCTPEMLDRFKKFEYVSEYVHKTEIELEEYNKTRKIDNAELVNGLRQTNLGVFRAYLEGYLRNQESINQEMTCMVRHLQPTDSGLPLEIYAFSANQQWEKYERVQADIFDHILAIIPQFELRVFQNPSGGDIREALDELR